MAFLAAPAVVAGTTTVGMGLAGLASAKSLMQKPQAPPYQGGGSLGGINPAILQQMYEQNAQEQQKKRTLSEILLSGQYGGMR